MATDDDKDLEAVEQPMTMTEWLCRHRLAFEAKRRWLHEEVDRMMDRLCGLHCRELA